MPTYEYICESCKHHFERFQSMTARTLRKCPECGKAKLVRLIGSGAGIIFKGSGFYQTDYRTENYNKGSKSDTTPAPAKEEGKKDPKPSTQDSGSKEPAKPQTPAKDAGKKG